MTNLLRVGFVALILLGLATQALRASRSETTVPAAEVLADGLQRLGISATAIPRSRLLMARSPQCGQPFVVGLLHSNGDENEMLRQLVKADVVVGYAYLGTLDPRPAAIMQLARWGWATLQFSLGVRATKPPSDMVVVAFPRSCVGLEAVDWVSLSP